MNRLYIFGLGSPFGWDRIGWLAVDKLRRDFEANAEIVIETLNHPTGLFAQPITSADEILFLDAMIGLAEPGTVQQYGPLDLPPTRPRLSTHGIDLKTTVALLTGMGTPDEHIHIFAVEAPWAEVGTEESPSAPAHMFQSSATSLASVVADWIEHRSE